MLHSVLVAFIDHLLWLLKKNGLNEYKYITCSDIFKYTDSLIDAVKKQINMFLPFAHSDLSLTHV